MTAPTIPPDMGILADELESNARVRVKKDGTDKGTRRTVNLKDTASIAWTATDDPVNEEVEIEAAFAADMATQAELDAHAAAADPHTGYVLESLLDAKGDLYAASAADTPARVPVGTDGAPLVADSTASAGVAWRDGAWTTFTPIIVQGVTPTLSASVGRFMRVGRIVVVRIEATVSSAGTAANAIEARGASPLPAAVSTYTGDTSPVGTFHLLDVSASTYYTGSCFIFTPGTPAFRGITNTATGYMGIGPAVTLASGDKVSLFATYEAAA